MKLSTLRQVGRSVLLTAFALLVLPIASSLSAQEQEKTAPAKHRLALATRADKFFSAPTLAI